MRPISAPTPPVPEPPYARRPHRDTGRLISVLATFACAALLVAGCGSGSTHDGSRTTLSADKGSSAVVRGRSGSRKHGGNRSTGNYSVAFARCMRAHGVRNFPNPIASGGELGPGSGINPASRAFQSALNGPCRRLATAGWTASGSGPVTR